MATVSVAQLRETALRATRSYGYDAEQAATIVDVMLHSQLRGGSQGVVKLVAPPGMPIDPDARAISFEHGSAPFAIGVDAGQNHAMVVVTAAVDRVIATCAQHGIGLAAIRNLNTSSGALGFYSRRLADAGLIGVVLAGSPPVVAAAGSSEPVFGTNPLSIAVPSSEGPIVLDMATAAIAFYGVIEAKLAGRPLPEGVAYDSAGEVTTDPAAAMEGALLTFDGGPKSSGLAFMVQALSGPLTGAAFAGIGDSARNWGGHVVVGLDADLLGTRDEVLEGMAKLAQQVRGTRPVRGAERVAVPGELGDDRARRALQTDETEIDDALWGQLLDIASRDA
jgi:L-2-hydroxycarboxylate dehydrogenase (NAD+)